jgi:hypothetical protein
LAKSIEWIVAAASALTVMGGGPDSRQTPSAWDKTMGVASQQHGRVVSRGSDGKDFFASGIAEW